MAHAKQMQWTRSRSVSINGCPCPGLPAAHEQLGTGRKKRVRSRACPPSFLASNSVADFSRGSTEARQPAQEAREKSEQTNPERDGMQPLPWYAQRIPRACGRLGSTVVGVGFSVDGKALECLERAFKDIEWHDTARPSSAGPSTMGSTRHRSSSSSSTQNYGNAILFLRVPLHHGSIITAGAYCCVHLRMPDRAKRASFPAVGGWWSALTSLEAQQKSERLAIRQYALANRPQLVGQPIASPRGTLRPSPSHPLLPLPPIITVASAPSSLIVSSPSPASSRSEGHPRYHGPSHQSSQVHRKLTQKPAHSTLCRRTPSPSPPPTPPIACACFHHIANATPRRRPFASRK